MMRRHNPYAPPGRKDEARFQLSDLLRWITPGNVLLFAMFLIEGLWPYLWLLVIGFGTAVAWHETPLTVPSILALLFLSYYSVQVLGQQRWPARKAQTVMAVFIVLVFLVVLRLENGGGYGLFQLGWLAFAQDQLIGGVFTSTQATVLVGAYLWWRGYHLARERITQEQVLHSFTVGLVLIVLGLFAWESFYRSGDLLGVSRGAALYVVVAYFFASLLALPLSHLLRIRAEMLRREGSAGFFSQHWGLQLLAFVTAIIIVGWIVATVFSFDVVTPLLWLIGVTSRVLSFVVYYLLYPVAWLAAGIVHAVRWLIGRFGNESNVQITLPDFSNLRRMTEEGTPESTAPWLILVKWVIVLAVIALVVMLLSRLLLGRRQRNRPTEALDEVHESLGGAKAFIRDLLIGLLRLFIWFGHRRDRVLRRIPVLRRMTQRGLPDRELEVREMYGVLLAEAGDAGFPRKEEQTPLEYLDTLERRLPQEREALERLTTDYVQVRYGEQPLPPEEKGLLNRMFGGVYQRLREIIRPSDAG